MIIDFSKISHGQAYAHMAQTVVPRPIAWVLSENETGDYNLAPFSYFSAISSDPALLMISIGKKPDGTLKDTTVNITQRKNYVIHITDEALLEAMNQSAATLPAGVPEIDELNLGLDLTDFENSPLPRIKQAKIAFACTLDEMIEIGNTPQSVIIGQINTLYIDDDISTESDNGRIKVHNDKLNPVSRLGINEYMAAGKVITLKRPA